MAPAAESTTTTSLDSSPLPADSPVQDDGDGDDELEDDDEGGSRDEDDDDEDESEDEEPRLKYQRLGGSVPSLLSSDAASCLTVAERIIALGTHDGTVHLLDYQGNQVREFRAHSATVNEVSFDAEGEYVGSCSDDGTVVINSLYTDEKEKFEYHRPMKAVALDPEYSRRASKQFATGGLAGQLLFNSKGWLGYRDQVLHSGEGTVHAVKWRTSLIAWANDAGVKVYDTVSHQRITFIERGPRAERLRPQLVWQDDTVLLIGWADCVKIAAVRIRGQDGRKGTLRAGTKYVEIVAVFHTDYYISGLAPYGEALVILAYLPDRDDGQSEVSSAFLRQGQAQRPEVRIVTWKNEELATDALSIHGYEHYKAKDYVLAHAPFAGSSSAGGQWAAGDEPLYYVVSPTDVVLAKPRDADDHVAWLLQHGWHEKALAAVEAGKARTELLEEVGSRYLDHLLLERQYAQAAALCPKLLRGSAPAWERWVFHFAHLRQLPSLAPYIPTSNPQLRDTVYEVVLNALVTNPVYHEQLLSTIQTWPSNIYSVPTIISAIQLQLSTGSKSLILKEALAKLYVVNKQYDKALAIFVELQKPDVFDFIQEHNLLTSIHDKVVQLMRLDGKRAVTLLVQQSNKIGAAEVVAQLQTAAGSDDKYRQLLHLYLHGLFEKDPNAGKDYHGLQVELYADYEPRLLLPFLRSSHHYSLDQAYEVCTKRGLTRERVFILGRMGNSREALAVIINELQDMEQAISFVNAQADEELWEELINQSLHKPEMVGSLLEHTVGHIDPLHLVNKVPVGMPIPHLRNRLVKIITDYRTETSLRLGCKEILKADCVDLLVRYYDEARHAIRVGGAAVDTNERDQSGANGGEILSSDIAGTSRGVVKSGRMPPNIGGSGRCCICLDSVALQNVAVVAFFCSHAYHETCLNDTPGISSSRQESTVRRVEGIMLDNTSSLTENGGDNSGAAPMRCILCTTAASAKQRPEANSNGRKSVTNRTSSGWSLSGEVT